MIVCFDCRARRQPLEWIDAWGVYEEGIENLLHALKFGNQHFLAEPLGLRMSSVVAARDDLEFDLVIAVPMHRRKLRKRGYNQAELLAGEVSANLALPMGRKLLVKSRDTDAQAHLPRNERRRNLRAAFEAAHEVAGKAVLLVDDVCTTGETLRACARALRRRKAGRVCAVTFARAL
jgi:competence protein ComFC